MIAADNAGVLQTLQAHPGRRGRKTDALGERELRDAALPLDLAENAQIGRIELYGSHRCRPERSVGSLRSAFAVVNCTDFRHSMAHDNVAPRPFGPPQAGLSLACRSDCPGDRGREAGARRTAPDPPRSRAGPQRLDANRITRLRGADPARAAVRRDRPRHIRPPTSSGAGAAVSPGA